MPLMCALLPFSRMKISLGKGGDLTIRSEGERGHRGWVCPLPRLVESSFYDGGEAGERAGETDEKRIGRERWVCAASGLHAHDLRKRLLVILGERCQEPIGVNGLHAERGEVAGKEVAQVKGDDVCPRPRRSRSDMPIFRINSHRGDQFLIPGDRRTGKFAAHCGEQGVDCRRVAPQFVDVHAARLVKNRVGPAQAAQAKGVGVEQQIAHVCLREYIGIEYGMGKGHS